MRKSRASRTDVRHAGALLLMVLTAGSCAVLSGLDDYEVTSGGQGAAPGTGGASTTGTGSAPTTTGGGGGSTPGQHEANCLDGLDDDGDGLIDCADLEDCAPADYECAPTPPTGWTANAFAGLVNFAEIDNLPECPSGTTGADFFADPSAASCSACSCVLDPNSASCFAPQFTCHWGSQNCSGGTQQVDATDTDRCLQFQGAVPSTGSCRITGPSTVRQAGTCTVTGASTLQDPAPWGRAVRVCQSDTRQGGGCDAGQVCQPRPPTGVPGLEGLSCLVKEGTDGCDPGWTQLDVQLFAGGTDQRSCSACGCNTSAVGCTGGSVTANSRNECVPEGAQTTLTTQCQNVTDALANDSFSLRSSLGTVTGQATCTGGQGQGSVVTEGPTRLCCRLPSPSAN
ncbi:hypothetical protein [Chondromyces apiculatus]|uniref:BNR repeat domain protein n=1 Tax=Chondromyces apiculatus DSM 436 TaxID=1192034 RepID=A0A017TDT3_9BACT|nr:hypothetical protein [Chondromyces apiculatus]EYF06970.1 Hypothetical protein CAP_1229 [Chondromyces apiculatus DSM 436]